MLSELASFVSEWGWIETLVSAGLALWVLISLARNAWRRLRSESPRARSIQQFVAESVGSSAQITDRLMARLRALIVDDAPDDFPIDYLERVFSRVDVVTSISLAELSQLQAYDVIFLDIKGVVREDLESGGLELIRRARSIHPKAILIGVSSKKFDPTVTEFFRLADIQLRKPIRGPDAQEQLSRLFERTHGPHARAKRIDDRLEQALRAEATPALRSAVVKYLSSPDGRLPILEALRVELGNAMHGAVCDDAVALREQLLFLKS